MRYKNRNIYTIGAPKCGGTSLNEWFSENTNMAVPIHDSYTADLRIRYNQGDETFKALRKNFYGASNRVWTDGGFHWITEEIAEKDPNSLQILNVRKDFNSWAWSFYQHFKRRKAHLYRGHLIWGEKYSNVRISGIPHLKELAEQYYKNFVKLARESKTMENRVVVKIESDNFQPLVDWIHNLRGNTFWQVQPMARKRISESEANSKPSARKKYEEERFKQIIESGIFSHLEDGWESEVVSLCIN